MNVKTQPDQTMPEPAKPLGLSQAELKEYSVLRALQAALAIHYGGSPRLSLELEISNQMQLRETRANGVSGIRVPFEALAVAVGSGQSGGFLTKTEVGPYASIFRRGLAARVGMTIMTGLTSDRLYPSGSGAPTGSWLNEEEDAPKSDLTLRAQTFIPHTWGTYIDVEHKIMRLTAGEPGQASRAEQAVRLELQRAAWGAVDQAVMTGAGGTLQPLGLLADDAIELVVLGTNGGELNYAALAQMLGVIGGNASADLGLAWVTNNKLRTKLLQTLKSIEGGTGFCWEDPKTPGADGTMLSLPAFIADAVPSNLEKGVSGPSCSAIALGPWVEGVVGVWGQGVDLVVSRAERWTKGGVSIAAFIDVDVLFRRREGFVVCLDALTE